jgi:hypothetical protein
MSVCSSSAASPPPQRAGLSDHGTASGLIPPKFSQSHFEARVTNAGCTSFAKAGPVQLPTMYGPDLAGDIARFNQGQSSSRAPTYSDMASGRVPDRYVGGTARMSAIADFTIQPLSTSGSNAPATLKFVPEANDQDLQQYHPRQSAESRYLPQVPAIPPTGHHSARSTGILSNTSEVPPSSVIAGVRTQPFFEQPGPGLPCGNGRLNRPRERDCQGEQARPWRPWRTTSEIDTAVRSILWCLPAYCSFQLTLHHSWARCARRKSKDDTPPMSQPRTLPVASATAVRHHWQAPQQ